MPQSAPIPGEKRRLQRIIFAGSSGFRQIAICRILVADIYSRSRNEVVLHRLNLQCDFPFGVPQTEPRKLRHDGQPLSLFLRREVYIVYRQMGRIEAIHLIDGVQDRKLGIDILIHVITSCSERDIGETVLEPCGQYRVDHLADSIPVSLRCGWRKALELLAEAGDHCLEIAESGCSLLLQLFVRGNAKLPLLKQTGKERVNDLVVIAHCAHISGNRSGLDKIHAAFQNGDSVKQFLITKKLIHGQLVFRDPCVELLFVLIVQIQCGCHNGHFLSTQ